MAPTHQIKSNKQSPALYIIYMFFKLYSSKPLRVYQAVSFIKSVVGSYFISKLAHFFNKVGKTSISMIVTTFEGS